MQSRRKDINLLMLAKRKSVTSLKTPLSPIIHDLKKLSGGFEIVADSKSYIVRAILIAVVGDNKGLNEAAGLTTNLMGTSCRFCTAAYSELPTFSADRKYPPRTDENLRAGINCNEVSAFAELQYVDLSCLFPLDIFHDLTEGVIIKFLSSILRHRLSSAGDVYQFNQRLKKFRFANGPISDLKFPEIAVGRKGASIYEFFKRLPEFEDLRVYDEIYWNLYLKLGEFGSRDAAVNAPAFSGQSLDSLHRLSVSLIS